MLTLATDITNGRSPPVTPHSSVQGPSLRVLRLQETTPAVPISWCPRRLSRQLAAPPVRLLAAAASVRHPHRLPAAALVDAAPAAARQPRAGARRVPIRPAAAPVGTAPAAARHPRQAVLRQAALPRAARPCGLLR